MPKPKTHFADSEEPLKEGTTLTTLCGREIPNSYFVWRLMPGEVNREFLSSIRNCSKCNQLLVDGQCIGDHSYLYGIIQGSQGEEVTEEAA